MIVWLRLLLALFLRSLSPAVLNMKILLQASYALCNFCDESDRRKFMRNREKIVTFLPRASLLAWISKLSHLNFDLLRQCWQNLWKICATYTALHYLYHVCICRMVRWWLYVNCTVSALNVTSIRLCKSQITNTERSPHVPPYAAFCHEYAACVVTADAHAFQELAKSKTEQRTLIHSHL